MPKPKFSDVEISANLLPDGRFQARISASSIHIDQPQLSVALPGTFASKSEALQAAKSYANEHFDRR